MRARRLALFALLVLPATVPAAVQAQRIRTRIGRPTTPPPAPLPPTAGPIARELQIQRSRWSASPYSVFSSMQLPSSSGMSSFSTMGMGTQGSYRLNDQFAMTADMSASVFGGPATTVTFEAGSRYSPLPLDAEIRPFVDARLAYVGMADFNSSYVGDGGGVTQYAEGGHSASGAGAVIGTGFEYTISNTFALSMGVSGVRSRMTNYVRDAVGNAPTRDRYWMNTFRLTIGLRYNRARSIPQARSAAEEEER